MKITQKKIIENTKKCSSFFLANLKSVRVLIISNTPTTFKKNQQSQDESP